MNTVSTTPTASSNRGNADDPTYAAFRARVQHRFAVCVEDVLEDTSRGGLYTTDVEDPWSVYLDAFPDETRKTHDCSTCRDFVRRYGTLVTIDGIGTTRPLLDPKDADDEHRSAFVALHRAVSRARITGVFLSSETEWGRAATKEWRHLAFLPPPALVYRGRSTRDTASAKVAERLQDFAQVSRALEEFSPAVLEQALRVLDSEHLYRSEKVIGPARWLRDLAVAVASTKNLRTKENLTWRAVASAPSGFCHPRSSMIGTLLEDLVAGLSFEEVSRKFAKKMNPLAYQRPQAAPTAGALVEAERFFAELGLAPALARRFARVEECVTTWVPVPKDRECLEGPSVFGHLAPKTKTPPGAHRFAQPGGMALPATRVTWEKFSRTVLPEARSLEVQVPRTGHYCALVTAEDPDAPAILQWDSAEHRNPVSWYVYSGGSPSTQWGLAPEAWVPVTAVTTQPSSWHDVDGKHAHQGAAAVFLLRGARDARWASAGGALFPEILRAELRPVRSVIEAYSRTAKLSGYEDSSACGLVFSKTAAATRNPAEVRVRATDRAGNVSEFVIDRWD